MESQDALKEFFLRVVDDIKKDAASKGQKIPVSSFHFQVDNRGGELFAADYFKYLVLGRGPGKAPPPDNMTKWVKDNPDVFARAKQVYKYLTEQQLGYIIGQKIAREGTAIFRGDKPGIDFLGAIEKNHDILMEKIAEAEIIKVGTVLKSALR